MRRLARATQLPDGKATLGNRSAVQPMPALDRRATVNLG
jgi:hypothetical protein